MLSKLRKYVNYDMWIFRVLGFLPPDFWSVTTLAASLVAGWFYHISNPIMGGIFVLLSGVADTIDGGVARNLNKRTRFGAILDSTMDRLGEGVIYAGLSTQYRVAIPALIFSYMVSYVRAKDDRVRSGIAERGDRLLVLILASFTGLIEPALYLITAAAALTTFMRLLEAKKLNP